MTEREVAALAKNFKRLLVPEVALIAEVDGEPAAVSIGLPNLNEAISDLDGHLFTLGVPVGLVKQLLQSEQKLELGGHSRFLTIFFSDLEAFSTLSEELPSHDLMRRGGHPA